MAVAYGAHLGVLLVQLGLNQSIFVPVVYQVTFLAYD
jgi:hypothetical protein